jgi:hypothetical protein
MCRRNLPSDIYADAALFLGGLAVAVVANTLLFGVCFGLLFRRES